MSSTDPHADELHGAASGTGGPNVLPMSENIDWRAANASLREENERLRLAQTKSRHAMIIAAQRIEKFKKRIRELQGQIVAASMALPSPDPGKRSNEKQHLVSHKRQKIMRSSKIAKKEASTSYQQSPPSGKSTKATSSSTGPSAKLPSKLQHSDSRRTNAAPRRSLATKTKKLLWYRRCHGPDAICQNLRGNFPSIDLEVGELADEVMSSFDKIHDLIFVANTIASVSYEHAQQHFKLWTRLLRGRDQDNTQFGSHSAWEKGLVRLSKCIRHTHQKLSNLVISLGSRKRFGVHMISSVISLLRGAALQMYLGEDDWGWNGADAITTAELDAKDGTEPPDWLGEALKKSKHVSLFPLSGALGENMAVAMSSSRLAAVICKASDRIEDIYAMCIDSIRLESVAGLPFLCTVLDVVPSVLGSACTSIMGNWGTPKSDSTVGSTSTSSSSEKRQLKNEGDIDAKNIPIIWPMRAAMEVTATRYFNMLEDSLKAVIDEETDTEQSKQKHLNPRLVRTLLYTLLMRLRVCTRTLCQKCKWSFRLSAVPLAISDIKDQSELKTTQNVFEATTLCLIQIALQDENISTGSFMLQRSFFEVQADSLCALQLICNAFPKYAIEIVVSQHIWPIYVKKKTPEEVTSKGKNEADDMIQHRQAAAAIMLCGFLSKLAIFRSTQITRNSSEHISPLFRHNLDEEDSAKIVSMGEVIRRKLANIVDEGIREWDAGIVQAARQSLELLQ